MQEMVQERDVTVSVPQASAEATVVRPRGVEIEHKPVFDFVKRLFDFVFSAVCLTAGLPIYLLIALVIVIDDPGNPFFVQTRIGRNGKPFRMIKFRTMCKNAEEQKDNLRAQNESGGVHYKAHQDVRILKTGRFLRAASLDELPQILHVFTGTMSFVGPRPFIQSEQAQLPDDRLSVRPGLSCYWQLADRRGMTPEEELELDYRYIRERSVKTDLKIIGMTIFTMFSRKNC